MTDTQIKLVVGAITILALFIRVPKLDIPIWSWILKGIGDSLNGSLKAQIKELSDKVNSISDSLEGHKKQQEVDDIKNCRVRFIRFDDEIRRGVKQGQEHWEDIMNDVDKYKKYCLDHPEFPNSKADKAIAHLTDTYNRLTLGDFL